MRVFTNWKWTEGVYLGKPIYEIHDLNGIDWYSLMDELDVRPETWVVGVGPKGDVMWVTDGPVSGLYVPVEGGTIIVTDSFEFSDNWRGCIWDGKMFHAPEETKKRTKEDIEQDLLKLTAELKGLE